MYIEVGERRKGVPQMILAAEAVVGVCACQHILGSLALVSDHEEVSRTGGSKEQNYTA